MGKQMHRRPRRLRKGKRFYRAISAFPFLHNLFLAAELRLLTFVFGTHIACRVLNVSYDGLLKFQPQCNRLPKEEARDEIPTRFGCGIFSPRTPAACGAVAGRSSSCAGRLQRITVC